MSQAVNAGPEQAAVRKVIYQLAELDGSDLDPEHVNPVQAANMAVENVQEILERQRELEGRVEELEQRAPKPSAKSYKAMDRHDRVTVLRERMTDRARSNGGKYATDYDGVINIFDGHPSAGYAYTLMELAADADGFDYGEAPDGTKRLTANVEA